MPERLVEHVEPCALLLQQQQQQHKHKHQQNDARLEVKLNETWSASPKTHVS